MAAEHMFGRAVEILAAATEIEGHPDNVAASLSGGIVICDGADVHRIDVPEGLEAVMVVPGRAVRTAQARAALPARSRSPTPSATSRSVAKLVLGLSRGDWELVGAGLGDRLHQPYRAHLYPRSAELVRLAPGARRARCDDLRRRPDRAGLGQDR